MSKIFRSSAALFASTLFLLAGCHKGPQDGVVATVNGRPIQRADLDKAYDAQLASNPQQQTPSQDMADAAHLQILQNLITEEMIEQRAAKEGLTATDAEVDARLAEVKAPYTEDQFQARLKANKLTLDEVRRDFRRDLTQKKLINKEINSKITVTDADVSNYYNSHKAEYNLADNQYHLAQIQVTNQPAQQAGNLQGSKATNDDEAHKKILALKSRLDSGEDFGTIASNFSERQDTAPNGGDMGFVPESQMKGDPTAYAAIMKLKAGQITDILPLLDATTHKPAGYSIYKLIAKEAAGQRDLSDTRVQQAIRQQLHDSRLQLLQAAYFEMLHDQAKIDNYFAEQIFKSVAK
ncbi:SurA N-terminal domain-containing protein [Granulicella sp. S156]|jgi:peptidyl-prolyl cis-trans isomerase SurA|uniref:SurA N-terminal domain-containing protein n=1 Tax=Granulicella sp. S156 TaxID=1747224 RepID=UPI00131C3483|nr:SurA N-terminal domain-containing protein [Granulicella sp. S156]